MQSMQVLVIAAAAASVSASEARVSLQAGVTPVQKVIQLLNGMMEKGKKEKHEEQVQFAAYKQFCDDTTVEKTRAIQEAEEKIEMLKADIQKNEADAAALGKEISAHDEDISVWQGDQKAATKVREMENDDYVATHKDYSEIIEAFLQQDPEAEDSENIGMGVSAPEANAYEFQSQGVIDMLQKLLDKFEDERNTLEKEETNSRHAFEMLMQDLTAQIDQATKAREEKSEIKAKKLQAAADAKGDLEDTTTTMEADKKYLADLTATCEQKATDFEARQTLRGEELQAIEKAIEIISGEAVSGNAEKHLPTLLQAKGKSLAQLRSVSQSPTQQRVAKYLQEKAKRLHSRVLSALAVRVADDPFKKVKQMIKDLIVRLMEEATEEATHKGWCDTELATNEQTRKEKTEAVETLHAEIDQLQASIAKLTEDISELTKAVADLDAAMAKATKLRQEEKAKNTETISDSQEAQTAVAQALTVLKEFYAKAAEATAFVQQKAEPEIFDKAYTGMGGESGGVVGMLEVIESDFARLESDTKAAEATAQKEYDEFMTDSKVDKSEKSTDIEHKTAKKQDQEQTLTIKNEDLEGTQKELDAALAYFDKLKPSCVDSGVSYEDRVARRKEEIESLQEALKILNGEDIA